MAPDSRRGLVGVMNFIGVIAGGIAVAYALIELFPPDVPSPPNGRRGSVNGMATAGIVRCATAQNSGSGDWRRRPGSWLKR
jgi:hypothetical protein